MATVSLGKVKFSWKGAYSSSTTYYEQDVVSFNGTTYICTTDSTSGTAPATVTTNLGTSTLSYYVKVIADGGSNYFHVDVTDGTGTYVKQKYLKLIEGNTYKIYQSDSSNDTHPLLFSSTSDGTHGGGVAYTSGVTYYLDGSAVSLATYQSGSFASATTRYIQIVVPTDAPNLFYYCHAHTGMGGSAPTAKLSVTVTVTTSNWNQFAQGVDSTGSVEGDILYYDGTQLASLPVGSENQVLKIDEATLLPNWEAESVRSGTKVARLKDFGMAGTYQGTTVLMDDGTLRYWGGNTAYNAGIGYLSNSKSQPIALPFPQEFPRINTTLTGQFMTDYRKMGACIDKNKHLWTWGTNVDGSMGIGVTTAGGTYEGRKGVPVNISKRTNFTGGIGSTTTEANRKKIVEIATPHGTDGTHGAVIVRDEDGKVHGTGYNAHGLMGQSNTTAQSQFKEYPTFGSTTDLKAKQIKLSNSTVPCLITLTNNGDVYHTGYSSYYQHGENNTTAHNVPTIVPNVGTTAGETPIDRLACVSYKGVFVIDTSDNMWNWGYDNNGAFGRGGVVGNYYNPTNVMANVDKVQCANTGTNYNGTLIIKKDGTLWGSGYNGYGQLGQGNTTQITSFAECKFSLLQSDGSYADQTLSSASMPFTIIEARFTGSASTITSAVLTSEGKVYTCGYNAHGQCGQGITGNNYIFKEVFGLPSKVAQIEGVGYSSSSSWNARMEDGQLYAWGNGTGYAIPEDDAHHSYVPKLVIF